MIDVTKYLSLDWTPEFTCWHFIQKIYQEELAIEIPPYELTVFTMVQEASEIMSGLLSPPLWIPIESPNKMSICVIGRKGMIYHVGFMLDNKSVLHLPRNSKPLVQKISSFSKSSDLSFFCHAQLH